jgi:hypothetical protein
MQSKTISKVQMLKTSIALYVSCQGRPAVSLQRFADADCALSWSYLCHGLRSPLSVLLSEDVLSENDIRD